MIVDTKFESADIREFPTLLVFLTQCIGKSALPSPQ
jgi:hypothetical protein